LHQRKENKEVHNIVVEKRLDVDNDDLWPMNSTAKYDNAYAMRMLQTYYFDWNMRDVIKGEIWSGAFTTAAAAGNVDVITYLMQDQRVANFINVDWAFSAAVKANHDQVVDILLGDQRIGVHEKYKAIANGIENISLDIAKKLYSDKRIDPSISFFEPGETSWRYSLFGYTVKANRFEIVQFLLSDDRVDPSVTNNGALKYAAENGFSEIVVLLLQDERVDPTIIRERYKTPEIVQALRARFQKGAESDQKRLKK
jgi:hypothetical protein